MTHDPAKHPPPSPGFRRTGRRSIRLKGHDYGGGRVYFVTICAHREAGKVFANDAAKRVVEECWRKIPEHFPQAEADEYVVMPDHVHGIIRMIGAKDFSPVLDGAKDPTHTPHGAKAPAHTPHTPDEGCPPAPAQGRPRGTSRTLGSVIRGFKIGVVKGLAAFSPAAPASPGAPRVWHRNYYEMIVRSAEAEHRIVEYIRMNPWRCVQDFGGGLRGIGNPALWNREKLGVLCSRNAPKIGRLPGGDVYFGGWHSPKEKEILEWLLNNKRQVIACPAWGIADSAFAPGVRKALGKTGC